MKRRRLTLRAETVRLLGVELQLVDGGHITRSMLSDCGLPVCHTMDPDTCWSDSCGTLCPAACPM